MTDTPELASIRARDAKSPCDLPVLRDRRALLAMVDALAAERDALQARVRELEVALAVSDDQATALREAIDDAMMHIDSRSPAHGILKNALAPQEDKP